MSYARWATRKEVAKQLVPVNNKTGVEKGGIPIMFDEKYIYIHLSFYICLLTPKRKTPNNTTPTVCQHTV